MTKKVQCLTCHGILIMSKVGSLKCKCGAIEATRDKIGNVDISRYPTDPYRWIVDPEKKKKAPRLQE